MGLSGKGWSCPYIYWKTARRRGVCLLLHAGLCLSSPRRRAFFILFLRWLVRFDDARWEFASFCTLAPVVLRLAGVHFSSHFSAGSGVSTLPAGNLPPFARWPLSFFASPACIFHSVSPLACSIRRCRRGICLLLHAGLCLSSSCRRAFFILFPRRLVRFDDARGEFASVCTLAPAVLHLAGVHFSSYFPAGMVVSPLGAVNLPPFARWSVQRGAVGKSIALHRGRCDPYGSHLPLQLDGQRQPSCLRSMLLWNYALTRYFVGKDINRYSKTDSGCNLHADVRGPYAQWAVIPGIQSPDCGREFFPSP